MGKIINLNEYRENKKKRINKNKNETIYSYDKKQNNLEFE